MAEVTTHMIMAGEGEQLITKGDEGFVAGAIRCLASETENSLPDDLLKKLAVTLGGTGIDLMKISASPKHVEQSLKQPS